MNIASFFRRLETIQSSFERHGFGSTVKLFLFKLVNAVAYLDCLHIITLERSNLKELSPAQSLKFSSRLATAEDLIAMHNDPRWDIDATKLEYSRSGDSCIVSYIDGQPAGYTWTHSDGRPELIPGLVISVPQDYLYNYSGLTLPEFRGSGLQAYRHHSVLSQPHWKERRALMGYVRATNFASQRGQAKSGYKPVGKVWLIGGGRRHFVALFSGGLRRMGIVRLPNHPSPANAPCDGRGTPSTIGPSI